MYSEDAQLLLAKIKKELNEIESDRKNIEELVDLEMQKFLSKLPVKERIDLQNKNFIDTHKEGLKKTILNSLKNVEIKLKHLQSNIMDTYQNLNFLS